MLSAVETKEVPARALISTSFSTPHLGGLQVHTASRLLPINTFSVVACTLPPFRCRSHIISLLFNCGNICDICSTWVAVNRRPLPVPAAPELDRDEKKYRHEKNTRMPTKINDGIEMVASSSWVDMMTDAGGVGIV